MAKLSQSPQVPAALFTAIVLVLTAGCATKPRIDWNAMLGVYSFDQAVMDYGPPDKQAALSDQSIVAEWLTDRGGYSGYASGFGMYGYYGRPYGYYPAYYAAPYTIHKSPDRYLRLVFDSAGKLKGWNQFAK